MKIKYLKIRFSKLATPIIYKSAVHSQIKPDKVGTAGPEKGKYIKLPNLQALSILYRFH